MIREEPLPIFVGCEPGSIEAQILLKCSLSHKIIDFGPRSIFNEPLISILARNMPLDDENKYGRLKDNMAVLCSIADGQLRTIALEKELQGHQDQVVKNLISVVEAQLRSFDGKTTEHEHKIAQVMQNMFTSMEEEMLLLGLEDDQEAKLMSRARTASDQLEQITDFSQDLKEGMDDVLAELYKLLKD